MLKLFAVLINIAASLHNKYNNDLNVFGDLCWCKQSVYRVAEGAISLFFRQANGRGGSWSSAPYL